MNEIIKIYTDGGCSPNPGKGGWAWCISHDEYKSGGEDDTTNNRMELQAIIEAIAYAVREYPANDVVVYSDSRYCVDGFNVWMNSWQKKDWMVKKKNLDLWKILFEYRDSVKLEWVRGHFGEPMNEFADALCNVEINS